MLPASSATLSSAGHSCTATAFGVVAGPHNVLASGRTSAREHMPTSSARLDLGAIIRLWPPVWLGLLLQPLPSCRIDRHAPVVACRQASRCFGGSRGPGHKHSCFARYMLLHQPEHKRPRPLRAENNLAVGERCNKDRSVPRQSHDSTSVWPPVVLAPALRVQQAGAPRWLTTEAPVTPSPRKTRPVGCNPCNKTAWAAVGRLLSRLRGLSRSLRAFVRRGRRRQLLSLHERSLE